MGSCGHVPGICFRANPVNVATGNKYERVEDYETVGQNTLQFARTYNGRQSIDNPTTSATELGVDWRSDFDRYLNILSPTTVAAERADGQVLTFTVNNGFFLTDTDVDVALAMTGGGAAPVNLQAVPPGTSFTLTDHDDTVETYTTVSATEAILTSIKARNGYTQTLSYNGSNQLASVTDSYGRALNFTYQHGLLSTVSTPDGLVLSYGYTAAGGGNVLTSVAYSTSPATNQTYLYENAALPFALTGIIDEDGNRYATWAYDNSGRAISSQHAGGADLTTIAYDDTTGNRIVTNALGEQEVYKFTVLQNVPKVSEIDRAAGGGVATATRLFTYDSDGYLASRTDWNSNQTNFVNDSHGQPTMITEAAGTPQQRVTTISYQNDNGGAFHLPTQIVGPRTTTALTYDASGELLTRTVTDTTVRSTPYSTEGQSRTWAYTWANSLLASSKGPRASFYELTQYGYDTSGALTSVTNALGQTTQITAHLPGGLPTTIVDPNGLTTNLTYDARDRLLTSTVEAQAPLTTSYHYDAAGNLTGKTWPDGSAYAFTYDAAHRLTQIADLDNRRIAYTLDALGNRTQMQILGGIGAVRLSRTATFDALGRTLTTVGGAGQTTAYAYDSNGNVTSITDPRGLVTTQAFDPLNREVQVTRPNGGVTTFGYNQLDQVNSVTDPNGNATSYVYDGFGDLIEEVSPDRGATVYTYNIGGLLTQKVDAAGAVTTHTWDALDRLVTTSYPADPTENVVYSYDQGADGIGHLTGISDAGGSLALSYNLRGLPVKQVRTHSPAVLTTGYSYDAANRVKTLSYPSGLVATYTRDDMGRITALTAQPVSGPALPVVSNVLYAPYGPVTALTYGDGSTETRTLDLDYRLTALVAPPLQNLVYSYDPDDNVTAIADGVTPANNQSLGYNKVNRLNAASGSYGALAYTYDLVGNRLTQTTTIGGAATGETFSYQPHSNRLAQIALSTGGFAHQFSYAATGVPTVDNRSGSVVDLAYNQDGRLAAAEQGATTIAQYVYDGFGQRILKGAIDVTSLYSYDQTGHLIEEDAVTANGAASPAADYLYLGEQPVGLSVAGNGLYFYHDDRLGTPQLVTNAQQSPVWSGTYQPFGPVTIVAAITQNSRLPGQYYDSELGWSHNGFRTYAQGLGRYLEPDPIGLAGGLDTYAYAGGNPVSNSDPQGTNFATNAAKWCLHNSICDAIFGPIGAFERRAVDWLQGCSTTPSPPAAGGPRGAEAINPSAEAAADFSQSSIIASGEELGGRMGQISSGAVDLALRPANAVAETPYQTVYGGYAIGATYNSAFIGQAMNGGFSDAYVTQQMRNAPNIRNAPQ